MNEIHVRIEVDAAHEVGEHEMTTLYYVTENKNAVIEQAEVHGTQRNAAGTDGGGWTVHVHGEDGVVEDVLLAP